MNLQLALVGLGALLVLSGIVIVAVRLIRDGPLSRSRGLREASQGTLEPEGRSAIFDLRDHGPGIGAFLLGLALLIAAAFL